MQENKKFEQAVMENISNELIALQFEVSNEKYNFPEVVFYRSNCIVRFIYDFGAIVCDFIDPKEKETLERLYGNTPRTLGYSIYPSYAVWKFLYPNDLINYGLYGYGIEEQVLAIKRLLLERLTNVLNGDFSWAADFVKNNNKISKKIEYMMTHWEMDNPVRVKFKNGDPSWEADFNEYKKYLDNLQQ